MAKCITKRPTKCLTKSVFVSYSRLLADFLSHLEKRVKLIKFEAKKGFFGTWKVEKPHLHPNSTLFMSLDRL